MSANLTDAQVDAAIKTLRLAIEAAENSNQAGENFVVAAARTALNADVSSECRNCGGAGWVCENHADRPWGGASSHPESCNCGGAGMPCGACCLRMASVGYSEPWRELADLAIAVVESAVRETSWGQPTFGPDAGEELRAEYNALIAKAGAA